MTETEPLFSSSEPTPPTDAAPPADRPAETSGRIQTPRDELAEPRVPSTRRTSKHEMIEAIRQRNRSAEPDFLSSFDERTLASYLQRLTHLANRRGRESVWVREGSSRSVVTRQPH